MSAAIPPEAAGSFADRVAVVSGVGPGLGRDLALAFARAGADLVLAARSAERLDEVAAEVQALGRRVLAQPTDITDAASCRALAAETQRRFGRADVLVNNAFEMGPMAPLEAVDADALLAPLRVNLVGSLQLTQALLPALKAQPEAAVVMIGSMIVRHVLPAMGPYAASKAALLAASQGLARELGPFGIRVNSVVPGYIWGPTLEGFFAQQAAERGVDPRKVYDEVASQTALGRLPTGPEIAAAVLFLASPAARAITGQSLDVNAGQFCH